MMARFLARRMVTYVVIVTAAIRLACLLTTDAQQTVRLQYRNSSPGPTTAQAEPSFQLFNDGAAAIPLNELTIRYYLTGSETYRFSCSWAMVGCTTVTGQFVRQAGDDQYLELGFTGGTLNPGATSGDIQLRLSRADGRIFTQSDDHSYGVQSSYANWDKVAVYVQGRLVWGTPGRTDTPTPQGAAAELFDDFSYAGSSDPLLALRGWTVRSGSGRPGVRGATWSPSAVSFPDGLLTLDSSTDGTASGTVQTSLLTANHKFHEGTYAARVRFSDTPTSGADGEHVVQTFFTIAPSGGDMDPDYCELDFEYLPNGGWDEPGTVLNATTWETYRAYPWQAVNAQTTERASFEGWHDLVIQVSGERVKYYVDGRLFADHGDIHYPEQPMRIQFNQWFIDLSGASTTRTYRQQVDWIYHIKDQVVSPAAVQLGVAAFRAAGTAFIDTVPAPPSGVQPSVEAGQDLAPSPPR
ncbi:glycosyl hydrolase family protein [Nonomuraea turkmeniaca]|uniref:Glycosyl hydrolase family protein n=1 Tax=Nonomuraea turkmeniaca TaxID=103838 RepID=A0A5S4FU01_9ACTN|nr:cellulose binding domain-containing protein [Nonomuraea turkmeniaca]TMR24138.1 glycosyl hydrolase family protein [Nonomuraea turkmeniaca]